MASTLLSLEITGVMQHQFFAQADYSSVTQIKESLYPEWSQGFSLI